MTLFVLLALIASCAFQTSLAGAISSADTTIETTSQKPQITDFSAEITSLPDLQRPTNPTEDVIGIRNFTEKTESLEEEIDEYADYDHFNATEQIQNTNLSRILPANTADIVAGAFPFTAYVEGIGSPSLRGCTGALISLRFVLVPASCVDGVSSVSVQLGGVATADGLQKLTATKIMHPKYKTLSKDYNIALLRLSPMATQAPEVSPIELAPKTSSDDNKDIAGFSMTVIGYGPLVANGAVDTKILRTVELNVLGKSECLQLYRTTNVNSNVPYSSKQSCLGTSETRGLCGQEDIGAPVFQGTTPATFRLYGIVTYINSCTSNIPALFTRIGPHYDWITKVMRNSAF